MLKRRTVEKIKIKLYKLKNAYIVNYKYDKMYNFILF